MDLHISKARNMGTGIRKTESFWNGGRDHVSLLCGAKRNLSLYWLCLRKPQSQVAQVSVNTAGRDVPLVDSEPHLHPDDAWRTSVGIYLPSDSYHLWGATCVHTKPDEFYWAAHLERSQGFLKEHCELQGTREMFHSWPYAMAQKCWSGGKWSQEWQAMRKKEKNKRHTIKRKWVLKTPPRIWVLHSSSDLGMDQLHTVHF